MDNKMSSCGEEDDSLLALPPHKLNPVKRPRYQQDTTSKTTEQTAGSSSSIENKSLTKLDDAHSSNSFASLDITGSVHTEACARPATSMEPEQCMFNAAINGWQQRQELIGILDNHINYRQEGRDPWRQDVVIGPPLIEHQAVTVAIEQHGLQVTSYVPCNIPNAQTRPMSMGVSEHLRGTEMMSRDPMELAESHATQQQLEHDSFLNAAVAAAIQEKGLIAFSEGGDI